jgi:heat shock protein HtpX
MSSTPSLVGRAFLAVGLMIGFYILAVVIAGALLYIPYAGWTYAGKLHANLIFFCVVGAGTIFWAILPRPDRFIPPGPALHPKDHPKLFEVLAGIATATQQDMPSEVYLTAEVNAWVMDRGGMMGFGSRRVMGLGLSLLQVLSVSQLRAVVAHEFGHFHGGDTKLGPWIYKTRAAIGRTLEGLAECSSLLQKPFLWYGKAFLRMTHAVSRRQEFTADTLAACIVGSRPLIEGLKLTYGAAYAFDAYWLNEVAPVLKYGFHPPLAEGFRRYLASPRIAAAISTSLDRELAEGETNSYDTHPPLRARIAALEPQSDRETPEPDLPAVSLLGEIPRLETQLINTISAEPAAQTSQLVAWDDVGEKIWAPTWEAYAGEYSKVLSGITPRTLPQLARNLDSFSQRLRESDGADLAAEERRKQASATLGVALAVALSRNGWELHVFPGEDAVCERNGTLMKPFDMVPKLASGELTAEAWQDFSGVAGIADLDLGGETIMPQEASSDQRAL